MRIAVILLACAAVLPAQKLDQLTLHNVKADAVTFKGKPAIHLTPTAPGDAMAVVTAPEFDFQDGAIEIEVAGAPAPGAGDAARGFIGVAFRVQPALDRFELIYIRPTNGRADDQLRRNHSTQYVSFPDWPWERLRQQFPAVYESYVDLEPAVWTKVRITAEGAKARLYVHHFDQPVLIVNDLKLPPAKGQIALWVGPGTDGYFTGLHR